MTVWFRVMKFSRSLPDIGFPAVFPACVKSVQRLKPYRFVLVHN